ncbi:MAG: histidine kinase [Caldimonas sp.]
MTGVRRAATLWGLALLLAASAGAADDAPLTLRQARMAATIDGQAMPATTIELPLHWDVIYQGRSGSADLTLDFDLPPGADAGREPYALFIARIGTAYEIELNGMLLSRAGSMVDKRDRWYAKQPVSQSFPASLLRTHNQLRVHVRTDAGYRSGLSPVIVGTDQAVGPLARQADLLRVALPQATSVFSLLVACFCALLWWQQRDPLYAWAGAGEALWAVTIADTVVETAALPWPYWGIFLLLLRAAWAWSLYGIAQQVFGRRPRIEYWTMLSALAAVPLFIGLIVALESTRPLLAWYAITFAVWLWVIVQLAASAWRMPSPERLMILLAVTAVVAASLRDVVAARFDAALYAESAWAKYVGALVGAAMMWIVSRRFLAARADVLHLNASLAQRVEQKEHELRDSFERLSQVERSRAVLAERERILRDLHDGVGSNLATAVRQLESGRATPQDVVQSLRESMDHLKLSIDALNLPAGDVNALLASLRYRLQPRIESAGLRFEWHVEPLPRWERGNEEAMRHLQFLLLEAISNVLQHAHASTLTVRADPVDAVIVIALSDDGLGIHGDAGHGLRSMQLRADAIGAALSVEPGAPGTRVMVRLLPLPASTAPGVRFEGER